MIFLIYQNLCIPLIKWSNIHSIPSWVHCAKHLFKISEESARMFIFILFLFTLWGLILAIIFAFIFHTLRAFNDIQTIYPIFRYIVFFQMLKKKRDEDPKTIDFFQFLIFLFCHGIESKNYKLNRCLYFSHCAISLYKSV